MADHALNCQEHRHLQSRKDHTCKHCGIKLCTHHRLGLRGCTRPAEHQGPHTNAWAVILKPTALQEYWEDADGIFINNHEDWVRLVDQSFPKLRH